MDLAERVKLDRVKSGSSVSRPIHGYLVRRRQKRKRHRGGTELCLNLAGLPHLILGFQNYGYEVGIIEPRINNVIACL
jgi:hypothetical protein